MTNRTDSFNRANSTTTLGTPSDGGSAWTYPGSAVLGISGNAAYSPTSQSQAIAVLESSASAGTAQITLGSFPTVEEVGICFRVVDDNNYLLVWVKEGAGFRLFERVAGTFTERGTANATNPLAGDIVSVDVSGTSVTVRRNGTALTGLTGVTMTPHSTATRHGIRFHNSISARIDAFAWTDLVTSTLSGNATLSPITASGGLLSLASSLTGSAALSAIIASGSLGLAPGVALVPELRNWGGSLQAGVTIPVVTVCRLSTGAQVLTLTNQVTNGSGNLSITNAALVPGTAYMVIGWNADGSQRFAAPIVAA